MSINSDDQTIPMPKPGVEPGGMEEKPRRRSVRGVIGRVLLGLLVVILFGAAGGYFGAMAGINLRLAAQTGQISLETATQFQLGVLDLAAGNLQTARQRFEYVISLDPGFPGAQQKLVEAMTYIQLSAVPTQVPTPTLAPTPDTRGVDDLINQATQFAKEKKWDQTIAALESLRKADPTYRAIIADGLYYYALRSRGMDRIGNKGELEPGMYDLAVAERFGPLDRDAENYRMWARQYVAGASFWEVDWEKAVRYFSMVAPSVPSFHDSSGMTASERYRRALIGYGDDLVVKGEWCKAAEQYELALNIRGNATVEPTATTVSKRCSESKSTPRPPATQAPVGTPTLTPTPTVSPTGGVVPTATPPAATSTPPPPTTSAPTNTGTPKP
jgi:tetratricopeptide (TPR) repeat protein